MGAECAICGGGVYFETCGIDGCEYAVAGECQRCGERTPHACPEHPRTNASRAADQ